MIKADAKKNGKNLIVEYENGKFTFNGKEDESLETELRILLKAKLPIFGTYIAKDAMEELNIIGTLGEYFFDKGTIVESDPEIIGEWEKGVIF